MAINRHGGGARTNKNGLKFEQETDLKDALINAGYSVSNKNIVHDQFGNCLALIAPKHKFYKHLLEPEGVYWENYISKKLLPDEALLNFTNDTVYIIEKKFQHDSGSVDEKLQTCDFKKKQYKKLLYDTNYNIEYIYVCNDWFKQDCYRDVHDYIQSVGCHIFFNEIPLSFLDLPLPNN